MKRFATNFPRVRMVVLAHWSKGKKKEAYQVVSISLYYISNAAKPIEKANGLEKILTMK